MKSAQKPTCSNASGWKRMRGEAWPSARQWKAKPTAQPKVISF
jgi:hypothetical protein